MKRTPSHTPHFVVYTSGLLLAAVLLMGCPNEPTAPETDASTSSSPEVEDETPAPSPKVPVIARYKGKGVVGKDNSVCKNAWSTSEWSTRQKTATLLKGTATATWAGGKPQISLHKSNVQFLKGDVLVGDTKVQAPSRITEGQTFQLSWTTELEFPEEFDHVRIDFLCK